MAFVIRHKQLPYFLTWEGTKGSFDDFRDQINMEMKQNGLDSFTVSIMEDNIYLTEERDITQPQSSQVVRKGPRVDKEVKGKGPRSRGNVVSKPRKRKSPKKSPYKKGGGEDPKLRSRGVGSNVKPPTKSVSKGLDSFVGDAPTQKNQSEKKDA